MRSRVTSSLLIVALSGCPAKADEVARAAEPPVSSSARAEAPAAGRAARSTPSATAISAGVVHVGSPPGTEGRDPALEADVVPLELGAFTIDERLYPNRAGEPPRTGVTRSTSEALCRAEGKRLCTELEWERACDEDAFELAPRIAEWTSSTAGARFEASAGDSVVRGSAEATSRCSARAARAPDVADEGVSFRCCGGERQDAPYPAESARRTFREVDIAIETLRSALEDVPELARFAGSFEPFAEGDVSAVFTRGNAAPTLPEGTRRARKVVEWSPRRGELAWVVTGRSGEDSIIAVLYPLATGELVHAASMILEGDPLSVLVTYVPGNPLTLAWTTCFGCSGEGGEIQYREDGRIVVVQL